MDDNSCCVIVKPPPHKSLIKGFNSSAGQGWSKLDVITPLMHSYLKVIRPRSQLTDRLFVLHSV
eukprot:5418554-Amphidinium_carterae.2